jgi:acetylornithine deacetylase/succinyl-diaminopimelate desuccinylase family protein
MGTQPAAVVTDDERRVLDRVGESELVEIAQRLVRAPGQNPPGGEAATAAVLEQVCRARGFAVEVADVVPGRPNLRAVLAGGDGPGLLLLGHTDVVPVGDDGWTVDPFGGQVRDGRLYGRGSTDMKGGLAACVVAMASLAREGVALAGPVELAALVDEEEHGIGIRRYVADNTRAYAPCVVAEPTDLQTVIAARGDAYLDIVVHGLAAHSGRPDDGRNAIYGGAAVITMLERWHAELTRAVHPLVGPPTWSVGLVSGGRGVSTVPAACHIGADRRLQPGESATQVLADLRDRVAELGLERQGLRVDVAMSMDMPGFETPPDHPVVVGADAALRDAGGPGLPLGGWTAACDGGFVARDLDVPTLVLGPGSVNDQAHRTDESVGVGELVIAARAYALTALRFLS